MRIIYEIISIIIASFCGWLFYLFLYATPKIFPQGLSMIGGLIVFFIILIIAFEGIHIIYEE